MCSSVMKTSVSMDSSDQKKTRMKLKKFLTRRPTYQAVRDKGYIKGIQTEHNTGRYLHFLIISHMWTCATGWISDNRQRVLAHLPLHRWEKEMCVDDSQIRCLAVVWRVCASGKTHQCPTLSKCASTTWRTQVTPIWLPRVSFHLFSFSFKNRAKSDQIRDTNTGRRQWGYDTQNEWDDLPEMCLFRRMKLNLTAKIFYSQRLILRKTTDSFSDADDSVQPFQSQWFNQTRAYHLYSTLWRPQTSFQSILEAHNKRQLVEHLCMSVLS